MRVAFVVQRYGGEVAGGAEALCRRTARALTQIGVHATVLTTTARDYVSWQPHYPAGETVEEGVRVHRFPADAPDPRRANRLARRIAAGLGGWDDERAWALAQGPVTPGLLEELHRTRDGYDVVALWTYLYATTQLAIPLVADRALLVPTAHDEPMLRFAITRGVVALAAGLAFLTPEERTLVDDIHGIGSRPAVVVGPGIDPAASPVRPGPIMRGLPPRFALYVGRLDRGKGVDELFRAHHAYRRAGGSLGLVLAGRAAPGVRAPIWAVSLGFVDETTRAALLAACEVVVVPSRNESLSLTAMEAWQAGRPTLSTAHSEVLAGQTARSAGGLLYADAATYTSQLARLALDPGLRERLGAAGSRWAAAQTWSAAAARWHDLLTRVRRLRQG